MVITLKHVYNEKYTIDPKFLGSELLALPLRIYKYSETCLNWYSFGPKKNVCLDRLSD